MVICFILCFKTISHSFEMPFLSRMLIISIELNSWRKNIHLFREAFTHLFELYIEIHLITNQLYFADIFFGISTSKIYSLFRA